MGVTVDVTEGVTGRVAVGMTVGTTVGTTVSVTMGMAEGVVAVGIAVGVVIVSISAGIAVGTAVSESWGFTPSGSGITVKTLETALKMVPSGVAVTSQRSPGLASAGKVTSCRIIPCALVRTIATGSVYPPTGPTLIVTHLLGSKPYPISSTVVPGGPLVGQMLIKGGPL